MCTFKVHILCQKAKQKHFTNKQNNSQIKNLFHFSDVSNFSFKTYTATQKNITTKYIKEYLHFLINKFWYILPDLYQ